MATDPGGWEFFWLLWPSQRGCLADLCSAANREEVSPSRQLSACCCLAILQWLKGGCIGECEKLMLAKTAGLPINPKGFHGSAGVLKQWPALEWKAGPSWLILPRNGA